MARRWKRRVVAGFGSTSGWSGPAERGRANGRHTPLKAFSNILSCQVGSSSHLAAVEGGTVGGSRS